MGNSIPRRIQRKRVKGWRMPEGAVYVGRPTKWGNPFEVDVHGDAATCAFLYCEWLAGRVEAPRMVRRPLVRELVELRGRDLVCWCPLDQWCHADFLLDVANKGASEQ